LANKGIKGKVINLQLEKLHQGSNLRFVVSVAKQYPKTQGLTTFPILIQRRQTLAYIKGCTTFWTEKHLLALRFGHI